MNTCLLPPDKVAAFITKTTARRQSASESVSRIRETLAKAAEEQSHDQLLTIVEELARYSTMVAMFNAFLPHPGTPEPTPEVLASRFITLSLAKADATWSGTGNGLRLVAHETRIEILQFLRYEIFPA